MQAINTILKRMRQKDDHPAMFWQNKEYSYRQFVQEIDTWQKRLIKNGIGPGMVCGVLGDYTPQTCALFFALMQCRAILAPFTIDTIRELPKLMEISGAQCLFKMGTNDWNIELIKDAPQNSLVNTFRKEQMPGLIVFTSGSTGEPKGILHNCERVLQKFIAERRGWKTALFLMMDHFGGFNTLMSVFAYGGTGVCIPERSPHMVCKVIEQSRATLLPATPTFLNLLIASGSYREFDLSSIQLITYGTEVMPEATLKKIPGVFPNAKLKQTYGLSELGVLRSKSQSDSSPWVKIGGEGFEVKVREGILWVRSQSNMVGYLNAPSNFDEDGWLCTGDQVQVRGEYMRILGRKSDIINVGGQKVFPVEVETVLLEADNINEAAVYGIPHSLMGEVVHAKVSLSKSEDPLLLSERLRKHCLDRLTRYKIPLRYKIVEQKALQSNRCKKVRE